MCNRNRARWRLCFSVAVLACGCTQPGTRATRCVGSLLPEGDERLATQAAIHREREVFAWDLRKRREVDAWTAVRFDAVFRPSEKGLGLKSTTADPQLWRDCDIDAEEVDAIRVELSGVAKGAPVEIFWAARGEPFTGGRSLRVDQPDATGSVLPTYTFRVRGHDAWKGTIGRLRVDPSEVPNRRVTLHSVAALELRPDTEMLADVLARSWWVDFRGEARRVLLSPPGEACEREVDIPSRASLRFGYGLTGRIQEPVRFRITASARGGEPEQLWERLVAPCDPEVGCSWTDAVVDLAPLAGERVRLRFESVAEGPLDPMDGMPVWSDLQLVAPVARQRPPNLVLIVLDTLRADRLSLYGYTRPTSPHIDAWARERGVVFRNVVASAPWTLPSHVSLFTGLDPMRHGANTVAPARSNLLTLAERLRAAGYTTRAITGGGYLATEYGLMQGFDRLTYYFDPRVRPAETGNDIDFGVQAACDWLAASKDRPFFLFFHTYETHAPYVVRSPHFERLRGSSWTGPEPLVTTEPITPVREQGFVVDGRFMRRVNDGAPHFAPVEPGNLQLVNDLYDSSVAYADEKVGLVLDRLHELGLERDTLVVLTSDHGEALGERGRAGHASLQDCELMVPLVLALPDGHRRVTEIVDQVRLLDLAPTVLDLLGLPPLPGIDGVSLAPLLADGELGVPLEAWSYASSTNYGVGLRVENRIKYTYNNTAWPPLHGAEELFLLADDSRCEVNLAPHNPAAPVLRERTVGHYAAASSGLRARLSNRERQPLLVTFAGPIAVPLRVKTVARTVAGIEWRANRVEVTVAPLDDVTLVLEGQPSGELLLSAESEDSGSPRGVFTHLIRLERLEAPWQVLLTGTGWREDATADLASSTGVRVWVEGDLPRGPAADVDHEVQQQLRNLGYLQ